MSEQTLMILKMLEEGKITADEASDLLSKVEALEEEAAKPAAESEPGPRFGGPRHYRVPDPGQVTIPPIHIPEIPPVPIPDINRIVNDALREAFGEGFPHRHHAPGSHGKHGEHVDLAGASIAGARLEHTDLTDAKLNKKTRLQGADLRYASFVNADLRGTDLRGANLTYSDFTGANLNDADLQGAQMHHGAYTAADFSFSNLKGADFSLSDLTEASFRNVKHPGLSLRGMKMVGIRYETTGEDEAPEDYDEEAEEAVEAVEAMESDVSETASEEEVAYGEQAEETPEEHDEDLSWT
ncbi:MAG: pentapeptide repeat-containing protein [Anaerolineae bacterium]|nr:pentapeptide repeat-containing protein [Anaerolineae bacterium]